MGLALPASAHADADCGVSDTGVPDGSVLSALGPDWASVGGLRPSLAKDGIAIGASYTGEGFHNWGGIKDGSAYDGVLTMTADVNMAKLAGWKGGCVHASAFEIHGNSITAEDIGSLMPVSNLEATPAARLFELWFEQHLFNDKLAVKVGQISADTEFIISQGGTHFLNSTWGWPSIAAADMPQGGPAYPLATPGLRVAYNPTDNLGFLVGVFNGSPAGPHCQGDPQLCNNDGLDFRLDTPPLLIAEANYKYNQDKLGGEIKVGGWNQFGSSHDQRFDTGGQLIAVTGNVGRIIDDDYGIYGIIDQMLWRAPGGKDAKGLSYFGRIMGAPSDQNLIDFYADTGLTYDNIPGRPDDVIAIGFAYTGISNRVSGFDRDSGFSVIQNHEAVMELCYTYQVAPGWTLQPDFQYFWQPGGGVENPNGKGTVDNAAVIGARTVLTF